MRKIAAILLPVMLLLTGCGKTAEPKWEGRTESQWTAIRTTAEGIVLPMAEIYGISDMEFADTENMGFDEACIFQSEAYGKLTPEEKLGLIADVALVVYKEKPFPEESGISGKGLSLQIESDGKRYKQFTWDGNSILWEDSKEVLTMETAYAQAVNGSLNANMEKLDAAIEAGNKVEAELELIDRAAKGACLSCETAYREGTGGAKMIAQTGFCSNKCRNRMTGK